MEFTVEELEGFTVKELKEHLQYWEAELVKLARLPRPKSKELQEVRDGRIQYAIERVQDIHTELKPWVEWIESERRKAEEQTA